MFVFWALMILGGLILNSEQIILASAVTLILIRTMKVDSKFLKYGNWFHWYFISLIEMF